MYSDLDLKVKDVDDLDEIQRANLLWHHAYKIMS